MSSESPPTPFMMLCASLGTQVHMALGLIQDPVEKKAVVELPAAAQGIEMLSMLEAKTKGNLDEAEEKLLGDLLMQLRLIYVEVAKMSDGAPSPDDEQEAS